MLNMSPSSSRTIPYFWLGGSGIWKSTAAGYGICRKTCAGWRDEGTLLCTLLCKKLAQGCYLFNHRWQDRGSNSQFLVVISSMLTTAPHRPQRPQRPLRPLRPQITYFPKGRIAVSTDLLLGGGRPQCDECGCALRANSVMYVSSFVVALRSTACRWSSGSLDLVRDLICFIFEMVCSQM